MATTYKVLGQSNPAATTSTALYTVPALKQTVVSTITVANLAATDATFRISISINGATLSTKEYIAYDTTVRGNGLQAFTLGISLGAADIIRVFASSANVAFSAFGSEIG
jgi:hypothetical protein